ncbi:MAG: hypothetical protein HC923_01035 [Myxococcales bacterium]|nr:hypothetical protein [Myxococcales bacterium]
MLEADRRWEAVVARDRRADGTFLFGVLTTGIYCRPSCPARRPKRENVRFYADIASALKDGLRPCQRCRPDRSADDVERGVRETRAFIEAPPDADLRLNTLATRVDERSDENLGMTPLQDQRGGRDLEISHVTTETDLGFLTLGATDRGICFVRVRRGTGRDPGAASDGVSRTQK